MEAPSLPSVGYPCSGQPAPWQQSLFIQPNSELGKETLFAKPSCPGAHLFLLGDAGKLGGFQACPEFFSVFAYECRVFASQMLLLVAVQVILLLRPLKHIRPVWVCLLKQEGESSHDKSCFSLGEFAFIIPNCHKFLNYPFRKD